MVEEEQVSQQERNGNLQKSGNWKAKNMLYVMQMKVIQELLWIEVF